MGAVWVVAIVGLDVVFFGLGYLLGMLAMAQRVLGAGEVVKVGWLRFVKRG